MDQRERMLLADMANIMHDIPTWKEDLREAGYSEESISFMEDVVSLTIKKGAANVEIRKIMVPSPGVRVKTKDGAWEHAYHTEDIYRRA